MDANLCIGCQWSDGKCVIGWMASLEYHAMMTGKDSLTFRRTEVPLFSQPRSPTRAHCALTCHKNWIFSNTAVRTSISIVYWRPDQWKWNRLLEFQAWNLTNEWKRESKQRRKELPVKYTQIFYLNTWLIFFFPPHTVRSWESSVKW